MDEIKQVGLEDYIRRFNPKEIYDNQVIVMEITGEDAANIKPGQFPFRFEAASVTMVCKGEIRITMDYIPYTLQSNMVLERGNIHLMNNAQLSHDFMGYHIILDSRIFKSMAEEFVSIPKDYAVNKRNNPVQKIDNKDFQMLLDIVERLRKNMRRNDHFFQKALVMNEVRNFIMELFNIGMQKMKSSSTINISYIEDLALRFIKLLVTNCREWYEVSDYSTELCVTPVYLSRTIKSISGKTALEFIHDARISEAKILLRNPDNAIQDVADLLHFSDQSAFGKFFKKHTRMSPMEYKKNIISHI